MYQRCEINSMSGTADGSSEWKEGEMFLFLLSPRLNFGHSDCGIITNEATSNIKQTI